MGAEGCPGACPSSERSAGWSLAHRPGPGALECPAVACFILQHPAPAVGARVPVPSGDTPRPACELRQSPGRGWAGSLQREGGAGAAPSRHRRLPLHLAPRRSGSRLPRPQTVSPGPPLPAPRALTSAAGCPGLLALAGKVDCLGRLLLHLGWVSRAGRKQACVEFLFDPHGGINRKRRAPSRRALHLPLLWAPRSTDRRRFPGTPARCAVWARLGARPVSTLWGDSRLSVR